MVCWMSNTYVLSYLEWQVLHQRGLYGPYAAAQIRPRQCIRPQGKSRLFAIMVGSLMFLRLTAPNNFLSVSNDEYTVY